MSQAVNLEVASLHAGLPVPDGQHGWEESLLV